MNIYYFFSRRLQGVKNNSFSFMVSRIAVASVALGLGVMLISFSILGGFKSRIQDKIFSFGGQLQITKYDTNNSFEESPLSVNTNLYKNQQAIPGVSHMQVFSLKPGLLKTKEGVNGIVLKGISKDFNRSKFAENILEGNFFDFPDSSYSREIMISKKIADKMRIKLNDTVLIYFVQNPPRFRKLMVSGIYETGLEEFDELIILGDIRLLRRLNNWADTLVGGYEIFVNNINRTDEVSKFVFDNMDYDMQMEKIRDKYIQVFDWLSLLDRNVFIFLILILLVACFNMISTLSIMIMEKTNMIGILKAVGATNGQIRKIFVYNGLFIILRGLFYGNLVGLGFCALQYFLKIIPLDPENYYMNTVPIQWNWPVFVALNLLTFLLITLVLAIPVMVISNIKPVRSIKFD